MRSTSACCATAGWPAVTESVTLSWDGAQCLANIDKSDVAPSFRLSCTLLGAQAATGGAAESLGDQQLPFNLCYQEQL